MSKVADYQQEIREAIEQLEKPYATVSFHGDAERVIISMDTADLAITALRAQLEPVWIKVSDPPKDSRSVLIYSISGGVAEGCYDPLFDKWVQFRWSAKDIKITHWMPLPSAPKENE